MTAANEEEEEEEGGRRSLILIHVMKTFSLESSNAGIMPTWFHFPLHEKLYFSVFPKEVAENLLVYWNESAL